MFLTSERQRDRETESPTSLQNQAWQHVGDNGRGPTPNGSGVAQAARTAEECMQCCKRAHALNVPNDH